LNAEPEKIIEGEEEGEEKKKDNHKDTIKNNFSTSHNFLT
jgi:hypothetical protein